MLSHDLTPSKNRPIMSYGERISLMSPLTDNKNLLKDLEEILKTDVSEETVEQKEDYHKEFSKFSSSNAMEIKSSIDNISPEKQQKQLERILNQKKKWNGTLVGGQQAVLNCATKEEFTLAQPKPIAR